MRRQRSGQPRLRQHNVPNCSLNLNRILNLAPLTPQKLCRVAACAVLQMTQCRSGATPTWGIFARPISRACCSKPLFFQKNAPGMVVGITST